jgi:hypothetical protein
MARSMQRRRIQESRQGFASSLIFWCTISQSAVDRAGDTQGTHTDLGRSETDPHSGLVEAPVNERLLNATSGPIFNMPLRALPFGMQIGNVDAITYLLSIKPIVPAENDELLRIFHETIALADDANLIGRITHHGLEISLRNLRVACLRLLCAGMESTQLFTEQNGQLRSLRSK